MKDFELRLIAELMKNSRRSDRELATALRVSQPTVSRTIKKLEKEGYIKEYTMIPDFKKLGYEMIGITSLKVEENPRRIRENQKSNSGSRKKESPCGNNDREWRRQ